MISGLWQINPWKLSSVEAPTVNDILDTINKSMGNKAENMVL